MARGYEKPTGNLAWGEGAGLPYSHSCALCGRFASAFEVAGSAMPMVVDLPPPSCHGQKVQFAPDRGCDPNSGTWFVGNSSGIRQRAMPPSVGPFRCCLLTRLIRAGGELEALKTSNGDMTRETQMADNSRRGFLGLFLGVVAAGVAGTAFATSAPAQTLAPAPVPVPAPVEALQTDTESSMEPTQGRRGRGRRGGGRGRRGGGGIIIGRRRRRRRGLWRILRRL